MHLVGCTIEIYYDARSYKRQKRPYIFVSSVRRADKICSICIHLDAVYTKDRKCRSLTESKHYFTNKLKLAGLLLFQLQKN